MAHEPLEELVEASFTLVPRLYDGSGNSRGELGLGRRDGLGGCFPRR